MLQSARIDKYLWAIRVYKTRTEASDACKGGKVKLDGTNAKPSKEIKAGSRIEVRKGAVQYTLVVKEPLENRVGAKLVPDYVDNQTPQSEIDKLKAPVETFFLKRDRGMGRPTKKDRREMDGLFYDLEYSGSDLSFLDFMDEVDED